MSLRVYLGVLIFAVPLIAGCGKRQTGFLVKDGQPVYVTVDAAPGSRPMTRPVAADTATFTAIPSMPGATEGALEYARDSKNVFVGALTRPYQLKDCDPSTFAILTSDGKYSRDATHVYYCGTPLANADPASFQVLAPPYAKDSTHAYAGAVEIDVLDAVKFEVVHPGDSEFPLIAGYQTLNQREHVNPRTSIWGWARDSKAYYSADVRVEGADRESFEILNPLHAKDKHRVYYASERRVFPIPNADTATFEADGSVAARGRDKDHDFLRGEPVDKAGERQ